MNLKHFVAMFLALSTLSVGAQEGWFPLNMVIWNNGSLEE